MISYWSTSPAAAGPAAERSPHSKVIPRITQSKLPFVLLLPSCNLQLKKNLDALQLTLFNGHFHVQCGIKM